MSKTTQKNYSITTKLINKKLNLENLSIAFNYFLNNLPSVDDMKKYQDSLKDEDCKTARLNLKNEELEIIDFISDEYKLTKKAVVNLILSRCCHLPSLQTTKEVKQK